LIFFTLKKRFLIQESTLMMMLRAAQERGSTKIDWLESYHTFSFGDYFDPQHMGLSHLRVINDDIVAPGGGFGTHGHKDMEIVTIVLKGALQHKDSLGNGSIIQPGDVQRMTAGTGIRHSEFNASQVEPVHLLQIWILPDRKDLTPGYQQTTFHDSEKDNRLCLVASQDGREGSVTIHQDAEIYMSRIEFGYEVSYTVDKGRVVWLHVATGEAVVNGQTLKEGDALQADSGERLVIKSQNGAEVLLFNLQAIQAPIVDA
jgi:quercetin 2,3-dioxygenase